MFGTIVNTIAIVTGSLIGSVVQKGIKEEYQNGLFTAMGLAAHCAGHQCGCQQYARQPVSGVVYHQPGRRQLAGHHLKFRRPLSSLNRTIWHIPSGAGIVHRRAVVLYRHLIHFGTDSKRLIRRRNLSAHQRYPGLCHCYGAGFHLRHWYCSCRCHFIFLAGQHLSGRRFFVCLFIATTANGNLHHRRYTHRQFRHRHFGTEGLQNLKHAALFVDSRHLVCHKRIHRSITNKAAANRG